MDGFGGPGGEGLVVVVVVTEGDRGRGDGGGASRGTVGEHPEFDTVEGTVWHTQIFKLMKICTMNNLVYWQSCRPGPIFLTPSNTANNDWLLSKELL